MCGSPIRPASMLIRSPQRLLLQPGSVPSSQAQWQGLDLFTGQEPCLLKLRLKPSTQSLAVGLSGNSLSGFYNSYYGLGMGKKQPKPQFKAFLLNTRFLGEWSSPDGEGECHHQLFQCFWRLNRGAPRHCVPGGPRVSQAPLLIAVLGMGRCRGVHQEGTDLSSLPISGAEEQHLGIAQTLMLSSRRTQREPLPTGCVLISCTIRSHRAHGSSAGAQAGY